VSNHSTELSTRKVITRDWTGLRIRCSDMRVGGKLQNGRGQAAWAETGIHSSEPVSLRTSTMACQSIFEYLALASPWLTRAYNIPSRRTWLYTRCHQRHRPSSLTTRLPWVRPSTPLPLLGSGLSPPTPGDVLVSINISPPLYTTLPPIFILMPLLATKTTLPQTLSSCRPVPLSPVPPNKRFRPRHDTPLQ
jgi:hypothetical protein